MPEPEKQPPTLPYATPQRRPMSVGPQAFLSALVTVILLVMLAFGAGMLATTTGPESVTFMALMGLCVLCLTVYIATRLRNNPRRRGTMIGIYIGLGLAGLFWGFCGMVLNSLHHWH